MPVAVGEATAVGDGKGAFVGTWVAVGNTDAFATGVTVGITAWGVFAPAQATSPIAKNSPITIALVRRRIV